MKPFLALMAGAALLAGCAGLRTLSCDVASYGEWPAERKAGTYAFDRLPSQQAQAAETDKLEAAATPALQKAGFVPAAAGQEPDVLVQVGARTGRADRQPWDDPLWWRGGFGYGRHGPWGGPSWRLGATWQSPRYDREVAVLIRERASGKPLFEARASSEGLYQLDADTASALFNAALFDFPRQGVNPRRVVVPVGPAA